MFLILSDKKKNKDKRVWKKVSFIEKKNEKLKN